MYRIFFIIVVILAVALGLLVGTLNSDLVKVDLLWVQLEWPLGLLILSASVFGLFLGLILAWLLSILPLRSQLRKARARESQSASGTLNTLND